MRGNDNLQTYQYQLDQVNNALEDDPENEKLQNLAHKLKDLISLVSMSTPTEASVEPQPGATNVSAAKHLSKFKVGDLVEARFQKDGQWYEATVQSISLDRNLATVIYSGSTDTQHCQAKEIRIRTENSIKRPSESTQQPQKPHKQARTEPEVALGAKRKHTKQEHDQKKEAEHKEKQDSWKKFNAKIGRKDSSIFSTNSSGKVGVPPKPK